MDFLSVNGMNTSVQNAVSNTKNISKEAEKSAVSFSDVMSKVSYQLANSPVQKPDTITVRNSDSDQERTCMPIDETNRPVKQGVDDPTFEKSIDAGTDKNLNSDEKVGKNTDGESAVDANAKVDYLNSDISAAIQKAYNVSEEQIKSVMETLGLSYTDLLDSSKLASLIATMTDAPDASVMVVDTNFHSLLSELNALANTNDTAARDASNQLLSLLAGKVNGETPDATVMPVDGTGLKSSIMPIEGGIADDGTTLKLDGSEKSIDDSVKAIDAENEKQVRSDKLSDAIAKYDKAEGEDKTLSVEKVDYSTFAKTGEEEDNLKNLFADSGKTADNGEVLQTVASDVSAVAYSDVNPIEIMNQVAENVKASITEDVTKMEMQLNPQNLGKVLLELTSKNGVVSAQFTAQNDVVREALEAQIADLRETLNQQGIKVDAIEVTVSSHAFEENLDQNAQSQEKEGEMMEQISSLRRRSLSLGSLDTLAGLLSEEDRLVAQIMKDNGNSMDVTV